MPTVRERLRPSQAPAAAVSPGGCDVRACPRSRSASGCCCPLRRSRSGCWPWRCSPRCSPASAPCCVRASSTRSRAVTRSRRRASTRRRRGATDASAAGPSTCSSSARSVGVVATLYDGPSRSMRGSPGAHLHLEQDLRVAGIARQQALEVVDHRGRQAGRLDAHVQRRRSDPARRGGRLCLLDLLAGRRERLDGLHDEARLVGVLVIDPAAHEHDRVDAERTLVLGQRLAEDEDLDRIPRGRRASRTSSGRRCACGSSWRR